MGTYSPIILVLGTFIVAVTPEDMISIFFRGQCLSLNSKFGLILSKLSLIWSKVDSKAFAKQESKRPLLQDEKKKKQNVNPAEGHEMWRNQDTKLIKNNF